MNYLRRIVIGFCLALISAGAHAAKPSLRGPLIEIDGVKSLLSRNPEALAREVIRSGQIQFLGIAGFTVSAPGIDNDRCVADLDRVYAVPGTSDVLTDAQMALQAKAEAFAFRYNRIIRDHLVGQSIFQSFIVCVSSERNKK
jgi:hypothetical protein